MTHPPAGPDTPPPNPGPPRKPRYGAIPCRGCRNAAAQLVTSVRRGLTPVTDCPHAEVAA